MSLKIRRGTNAERLTITPVEGELIYTTDTKNLYIGDGIIAGGKFITGVGYTGSASTSIGYTGSATRIPTGGTTGQVLSKVSNTDYDVSWSTISGGFGGSGYTGSAGVGYTGSVGVGYTGSAGIGFNSDTVFIGNNNQGSVSVSSNQSNPTILKLANYNDGSDGITSVYARSRGTRSNKQRLINNDNIAYLAFVSERSGGTDTVAYIDVRVDNVTSDGIVPGSYGFYVTNTSGDFVQTLSMNSNQLTTIYGGFSTSAGDTPTNGSVISLLKVSSAFVINGNYTSTLSNGVDGQIKILIAKTVTSGQMTVTVTTAGWGGAGTIVLNATGKACTLQWFSNAWYCIGNNGAIFA
jgi:hypothetical protein